MTRKALIEHVQKLGAMRERIGKLEASERQLSKLVRDALEASKNGQVQSADFTACLAERRALQVDAAKLRRKAGPKLFMACIRVDVKAARRHFAENVLAKLGTVARSMQLRVSRRPATGK